MGQKIVLSSEFEVETCCTCGMVFAMLRDYKNKRLKDHKYFYCPAGHRQYYVSKSDEEKLQEELERCKSSRDFYQDRFDLEQDKCQAVERSRSSLRGVITRMKNKVTV